MTYNPDIHHRQSIRLRDYDYTANGAYFITICTQDRECLFGDIVDGVMHLNAAGAMVDEWWLKIPEKFPTVDIDCYTLMPNHFHGIINLTVGADPSVCPSLDVSPAPLVCPPLRIAPSSTNNHNQKQGGHVGPPLHEVVQWFKTMSTNTYFRGVKTLGWPAVNKRLWQRNYYEHVIRNDADLNATREYIVNNPAKWSDDDYFA